MSFLYNEGISPATYICTIQLTKQIKKMETLEKKAAEMLQKSEAEYNTKVEQYFCDVSDFNASKEVVDKVIEEFGGIDILVNNAFF